MLFFSEDSPWNKHSRLANQSQVISFFFLFFFQLNVDWSAIKYPDLRLWEEYPFYVSDFEWSSN